MQTATGSEKGPYSTDVILRSLADGSISAKTLLRADTGDTTTSAWKVAAEHPELAAHSGAPRAIPVAAAETKSPGRPPCPLCGGPLSSTVKKTFLGFRKISCQQCPNVDLYPLTPGYTNFYLAIVVLGALSVMIPLLVPPSVHSSRSGAASANAAGYEFGRVSIFALPALFALLKDRNIRRRHATRE